eukprot:CAMPEP_0174746472 /NCGR_PEP_ID=MMETSP1094-20130205/89165_1 /TAXON_ID=156173 /ORGANISM="Chrysochromulina brevifilum, Strain UTEX LB 985" /LENGTH=92 /DNA_ID=CAMNT_0015951187 /DNA_START=132 /DNA_END=410 /DNA_ORIENTATION=-
MTRSPTTLRRNVPPRSDTCRAVIEVLPSRAAQKGASAVCAEPVTGSSGMPESGPKKREMKSNSGASAGAVATTFASISANIGLSERISASFS